MMNKKTINRYMSAVAICLLLLVVNCGKSKKDLTLSPGEQGSAKEIYLKAKKKMRKSPDKARLLFKEIMHLYPDSPYAGRAKLGIADSYFKQKDSGSLELAAVEYQEFVNLYPNSPDAVYSKYQIAMCYFKKLKKPGRDQTKTHQAIKALESMVKMYPDTPEAREARAKITKARQNLATHYFGIGRSNFLLKAYRGAVNRFKQVIDDYPDYKHNDRLFYYTGRSYYGMWDFDTALSFF
ncbi:MAG: outer membrane protein assembly factor BamD, partial [bacterium]|nr:outer membrane protein assembly factor BamD [bacterium]